MRSEREETFTYYIQLQYTRLSYKIRSLWKGTSAVSEAAFLRQACNLVAVVRFLCLLSLLPLLFLYIPYCHSRIAYFYYCICVPIFGFVTWLHYSVKNCCKSFGLLGRDFHFFPFHFFLLSLCIFTITVFIEERPSVTKVSIRVIRKLKDSSQP